MLPTIEISLHRKGTESFINSDPSIISLLPSTETWVGGTKKFSTSTVRTAQTFKLIWSGSQEGIVVNSNGTTRRFDFVLVGKYDAIVQIGDHWKVNNQYFQVEWIAPYNGYEVKAGGNSYGSKPTG
jgi:hypothetical protein